MEGDNLKVLNSYSGDENFPAQDSQVTEGLIIGGEDHENALSPA